MLFKQDQEGYPGAEALLPLQVDAQQDFVLVLPAVELSGTSSPWVGTARASNETQILG